MSEWPVVRLGEVCEFLDHLRKPVTEKDRRNGPYPYYGANGQQGMIDGYLFDEPLLLLAEDGGHFNEPERGIAYTISGKSWVNNHAHVLRPKKSVDLRYIFRVIENMDVRRFVSGTTRSKLTKTGASRIELPLPRLSEQRRIATILDQADALGAKRVDSISRLDDIAQSAFISIFGDPRINEKCWPTTMLGSIAAVQGGLQVSRVRDSYSFRAPYLRVANVMRGGLALSEIKTIGVTAAELERTKLLRDDLLVVEGHGNPNEIGRVAAWDGSVDEITHQNHLIRVRLRSAQESNFVLHYLNSKSGRRHLLRSAKTTSGLNTISTGQVKETPVFLPPPGELARFYEITKVVGSTQRTNRRALAQFDALFASLQSRAFAGEL